MDNNIISADHMRECEQHAFDHGQDSFEFMRIAGNYVGDFCLKTYPNQQFAVLCGNGNNGGDGYIAALKLYQHHHDVTIYCDDTIDVSQLSNDTQKAKQQAIETGIAITSITQAHDISRDIIIIDALFGIGLNRGLSDELAILADNLQHHHCIAVDIASGVNADSGEIYNTAFRADHTISFWRAKKGHFLLPGVAYRGELHLCDLPMDNVKYNDDIVFLSKDNIPKFPIPDAFSHKYNRGMAAVIGAATHHTSSTEDLMPGAVKLAARACQRAGAGYVNIIAHWDSAHSYTHMNSIVVKRYKDRFTMMDYCDDPRLKTIIVGCGLGLNIGVRDLIKQLLDKQYPLVIDGDGISVFENMPGLLQSCDMPNHTIITPHEGEFKRVFGDIADDESLSKIDKARMAAARAKATIIYKGYDTVIAASDGRCAVLVENSPFLATAGSGDVLAGICGGFMAQGMNAYDAACLGAYVHSRCALDQGIGLIAEDLIDHLPTVMRHFVK